MKPLTRAVAVGCLLGGIVLAVPHAAAAAPTPAPAMQYRVLAFTKAAAGQHDSTAAGVTALKALSKERRFSLHVTEDATEFRADRLKQFRTVVFLNTSGDVLTPEQQAAFEEYFADGGGFLGVHSAIETEPDWPFLTQLLGTRATGESAVASATVKVADRGHDASKSLPEYWSRTDAWYNFAANVRGQSHVLATVDESTYAGGTNGFDHPVAWCKDYRGGRSFYTAGGHTAATFAEAGFRAHLGGAIAWTSGVADPVYSDCGATVLANYEQTKVSAPPNINEPIGFDQLPDGRLIQTVRDGRVRLHDPVTNTSKVIATIPVYTNSEDGMYGPAVDNDFATNKWVYLFYAPTVMEPPYPASTPGGSAPTAPQADPSAWDAWKGYFQLSRFKFVDGENPSLDLASEQKILKVDNNRGACCHVAGDIDFDKNNTLWLVTGDDTPAGGGNSGGFAPFNDQLTNETQTVRTLNATGGTWTLTFQGETTAPLAYNATAAQVLGALEALDAIGVGDVAATGGPANTANVSVNFRGAFAETNVSQLVTDASGLTGGATLPTAPANTTTQGGLYQPPWFDARRSSLNTNDLRGKVLRINVKPDGSYDVPAGNLFPESEDADGKTRPEIYAMGFRNPFRIQVDSDGVAYVTDYSPDSSVPGAFRGPAGTGRVEIVRKAANYGWPVCVSSRLPYYKWDFSLSVTRGEQFDCDDTTTGPANTSRWNTGRIATPPITDPDVWYSFQDAMWGTPCLEGYSQSPVQPCPRIFPEFGTGGVGPHGAAKYEFDPDNPSATKFPPYYDEAVFFGEFTRDYLKEIRLDSQKRVFKINNLLDCGQVGVRPPTVPFECDNPMDLQFGADGSFYLLTYGDGFFAANADAGLYRWSYVKGLRAPQAVLGATPTDGIAPLAVQFSSDGSTDRDPGDSIRFAWDFDGNGTTDSIDPNPTHTYTANGVYTARLTVTDSSGKTDSKTTVITVGNTSPTITINLPLDGDFFTFGQDVPYSVTVTDPEDGVVDCSRVEVTFVLVHDTHGHGEDSRTGCSGVLTTLAEDASHGGGLAGAVSVQYTDLGANGQPALTTVKQHVVQLRQQEVEFVQDQLGTTVANTGDVGGGQHRSSLDAGDWIALNNRFNFTNMDKRISFRFANNQPINTLRGLVDVRLNSPTGTTIATCELRATGSNNTFSTQPCDFTETVAGSNRLYLVFRQAPGGGTTTFGNLNWVQFSGAGITP
ncbi:MAG TPA: ThuA domain-containing protein [Solirubrobacteraceae bacterium]|jgi:PKD repeat protein/type 1 glutamine amidotransferase|nr:ThuA domain-containing protein [Solirubrobacteraceae bacterium]